MTQPDAYTFSDVQKEQTPHGRSYVIVQIGVRGWASETRIGFEKKSEFKVYIPAGKETRAADYVKQELGRRKLTGLYGFVSEKPPSVPLEERTGSTGEDGKRL